MSETPVLVLRRTCNTSITACKRPIENIYFLSMKDEQLFHHVQIQQKN